MKKEEIVKRYIDLTKKLNKFPTTFEVTEATVSERQIRKLFGNFTNLKNAAILESSHELRVVEQNDKKKKPFKPVRQTLKNFTVHSANIDELFKKAKLKDDEVLRVVVQPDTHVPEHDVKALKAFNEFIKYYKPHGFINIGDFMEMNSVSHWPSNSPSPRRITPEIKEARLVLDEIDKNLGSTCVMKKFIMGNHEDWLNQYLTAKVPELFDGLEDIGVSLKIENFLQLKERGYDVIPINEILNMGEAHFIHGYYTGTNHAKKHLDVFGVNIYYGHLHDVQAYSGISVKGIHEAMSLGCLRTLDASFLKGRPNNWLHAFGVFEFRKDGSYTRYVPIIIDGEFSFNGKIFKGK